MKYRLWLRKKLNTILGPIRRHSLNRTDFTIISNNCWGGVVYEYYGLKKCHLLSGCIFLLRNI